MKCYKLTDEHDQTHGETQWGPRVTHKTSGEGDFCGPGWLHAYSDPLIAVLHNPIHGAFDLATAHLWECRGAGKSQDDRGLKVGYTRLTTVRQVKMPQITTAQRVRYAIYCALAAQGKRWNPDTRAVEEV